METNEKTAPITIEKDRNTISLDLMNRMKLHGMAAAFTESLSSTFADAAYPACYGRIVISENSIYFCRLIQLCGNNSVSRPALYPGIFSMISVNHSCGFTPAFLQQAKNEYIMALHAAPSWLPANM